MSQARRIDRPDNCPFTRGDKIQIQFEGRSLEAYANEPIAMALLASGVRVFGRSIKYHRPRGPHCLRGHCSGCLMRVDGLPNIRTCDTPSRSGQVIERQLGWPGAHRDVFRVMDWVYGQGMDHHGMFTATGSLNRLSMPLVRKMTGFGDPPSADVPKPNSLRKRSAQVVVIGAGVSGLACSMAMAKAGQAVLLFESGDKIGGQLLDSTCRIGSGAQQRSGWQEREQIKQEFERLDGIELHQDTPVVGLYPTQEHACVVATNEGETFEVLAERVVVACGTYGGVSIFENNDLPGILAFRGLDRMICGWGVVPHEPILIDGDSDRALLLALSLAERKVALAGVVTRQTENPLLERLQTQGVDLYLGYHIHRARGGRWVERVELTQQQDKSADVVVECGLLAVDMPDMPAYELAHHMGCRVSFSSALGYRVVVDEKGQTSDKRIYATGGCTGVLDAQQAQLMGQRAGLACCESLGEEGCCRS